jgi:hypothetical protein
MDVPGSAPTPTASTNMMTSMLKTVVRGIVVTVTGMQVCVFVGNDESF